MLRTLVAAASCLMLVVTGCTGSGTEPAPTPTGPPVYRGPELPRLITEEIPVDPNLAVRSVDRPVTRLNENTLVLGAGGAFSVIDLRTGAEQWNGRDLPETFTLPEIGRVSLFTTDGWATADDRGGLLVEQYYQDPCPGDAGCTADRATLTEGKGLLAFSAVDRRLLWSAPVLPPVPRDSVGAKGRNNIFPSIVGASRDVVVVNIGGDPPHGTGYGPTDGTPRVTMGFDPATGEKLWEIPGVLTQKLVDGLALGVATPDDGGTLPTPLALDARTGRERWRLSEPGRWQDAAAGIALLDRADRNLTNPLQPRLVALPGGELGPELGQRSFVGLGTDLDGIPFASWVSNAPTGSTYALWSQRLSDPQPLHGPGQLDDLRFVHGVTNGYLWVGAGSRETRVTALDRSGTERSDALPGFPRYIDNDIVVTDGTGAVRIWRHRPA
ncbi:hypothetical protein CGZ97_04085 [Enemella evansiae]|nr:hypothetical protein CGZ97_04085 [Enemella evansiae]